MSGLQLFAVSVAVYAVLPLLYALLPSPYRSLLLYGHIAACIVLGGLLGAAYVMPLHGDVALLAGQVGYGGFLYATFIAVISGRDIQVLRNVIALTLTVNLVDYLILRISAAALDGRAAVNPLGVPSSFFDESLRIVGFGGALTVLELILFVGALEAVKVRLPSRAMVPVYPLVYVAILVLDGVVFPTILDLPPGQLGSQIAEGIQAKAIMGLLFALPLLVFVLADRRSVTAFEDTPLNLRDLPQLDHRLRAQASRASATLAGIMQSPSNAVLVVIDPTLRVAAANVGLERVLGWSPSEVVGRSLNDLWDQARPDANVSVADRQAFLEEAAALQTSQVYPVRHRNGGLRELSLSFSRVHDDSGNFIGYLAAGEDVSNRVRTEHALHEALEQERESQRRREEAVKFREDLVTVVSHELRTPIASISGYTELLAEGQFGELSDQQNDALRRISRNSRRLKTLVDDLLLLAGSGTVETARHEPLDLRAVVTQIEGRAREMARGRSMGLDVDLPDRPVTVAGDQASLERLVMNLVSNAVKFSEGGTVRLRVEDAEAEALLQVSDEGLGMSPEEMSQAFTPFYRTKAASVRAIQGSGLGLSVVARIAEQHEGEVALDSYPGEGTTVTVRLATVSAD